MNIKDVKEKIFYIVLATIIPICVTEIVNTGEKIDELKSETIYKYSEIKTELQLFYEKNKNKDIELKEINNKIKKLEESRDTLSEYYVTRAEFNRVIENQQKTIDKIDKNIEKLMEKVIYK